MRCVVRGIVVLLVLSVVRTETTPEENVALDENPIKQVNNAEDVIENPATDSKEDDAFSIEEGKGRRLCLSDKILPCLYFLVSKASCDGLLTQSRALYSVLSEIFENVLARNSNSPLIIL